MNSLLKILNTTFILFVVSVFLLYLIISILEIYKYRLLNLDYKNYKYSIKFYLVNDKDEIITTNKATVSTKKYIKKMDDIIEIEKNIEKLLKLEEGLHLELANWEMIE